MRPALFVVINLAADRARWEHMQRSCARFGVECERFEAVDATAWYARNDTAWDAAAYAALRREGVLAPGATPKPTIVALHLSHLRACAHAFRRVPDAAWVVVLEDDAEFLRSPANIRVPAGAELVHLHPRAQGKHGREGYALTRRACQQLQNGTLPMDRPGDLMTHALKTVVQAAAHPPYVRELRHAFGSSKEFIHYKCRNGETVPGAHASAPTIRAAKRLACAGAAFVYTAYSQDGLGVLGETHCVAWRDGAWSAWAPKWHHRTTERTRARCARLSAS